MVAIGEAEPTIYERLKELTDSVHSHCMIPVVFAEATTIARELAQFPDEHNASLIARSDSLKDEVQDQAADRK